MTRSNSARFLLAMLISAKLTLVVRGKRALSWPRHDMDLLPIKLKDLESFIEFHCGFLPDFMTEWCADHLGFHRSPRPVNIAF